MTPVRAPFTKPSARRMQDRCRARKQSLRRVAEIICDGFPPLTFTPVAAPKPD